MTSKEEKIKAFNPNNPADDDSNIFGLPFTASEASVVIIPLPWEVTVSYHAGTANAPSNILNASRQVDLYDPLVKDAWKAGLYMEPVNPAWSGKSMELRNCAVRIISMITSGRYRNEAAKFSEIMNRVNSGSYLFKEDVKKHALNLLQQSKLIIGLGGDHSTPLGIIEAMAEKHESFGILQLDAHCDLREAYEGFEYSHASVMYNAMKIPAISKLVQVGIRDYCQEELDRIKESNGRIVTFFDENMRNSLYEGESFRQLTDRIVEELPEKVYLSFDIDALDPKLCPHTGTPVAGGFEADQVVYLINRMINSGRKLIGFDINETGQGEWDANVSARLLFRISNLLSRSNGLV